MRSMRRWWPRLALLALAPGALVLLWWTGARRTGHDAAEAYPRPAHALDPERSEDAIVLPAAPSSAPARAAALPAAPPSSEPAASIEELLAATASDSAARDPTVIAGVVRTPDGRPIEAAVVRSAFVGMWNVGSETSTDSSGGFELELVQAGPWVIQASAPGFADSEGRVFEVVLGERVQDVELVLIRGGTLRGEVRGADGSLLAGVEVWVTARVGESTVDGRSGLQLETDPVGRFEVGDLRPGTYVITAQPRWDRPGPMREASDLRVAWVEVLSGATTEVVLEMGSRTPIRVYGRVTRAGEPVRTGVFARAAEFPSGAFTATDVDGLFELEVDGPGQYDLRVGPEIGYSTFHRTVVGPDEQRIDIELPASRIEGTILRTDGAALEGLSVALEPAIASVSTTTSAAVTQSDPRGRYAFRDVAPGAYVVRVGDCRAERDVVVEDGRDLDGIDFCLPPAGWLGGVVRRRDGRPVPGASIYLRDANGRILETWAKPGTDAAGRFGHFAVSRREISVFARCPDGASAEVPVQIAGEETVHVELVVEPGTLFRIAPVDASGEPVAAWVRVLDELGREQAPARVGSSDPVDALFGRRSELAVGPLLPGSYRTEAWTESGAKGSASVTLGGDERERAVAITLR